MTGRNYLKTTLLLAAMSGLLLGIGALLGGNWITIALVAAATRRAASIRSRRCSWHCSPRSPPRSSSWRSPAAASSAPTPAAPASRTTRWPWPARCAVRWVTPGDLEDLDIHPTQWRQLNDWLARAWPHIG
ncbi:MAG TPA: hypothetical protein VFQ68_44360 [Streptosporangiaceae bacterium]|nr:hypothetical protein [Streptosporangiaceae bacterium]